MKGNFPCRSKEGEPTRSKHINYLNNKRSTDEGRFLIYTRVTGRAVSSNHNLHAEILGGICGNCPISLRVENNLSTSSKGEVTLFFQLLPHARKVEDITTLIGMTITHRKDLRSKIIVILLNNLKEDKYPNTVIVTTRVWVIIKRLLLYDKEPSG